MSLKRTLLFTAAATLALDLAAGQQAGAGAQAAERASKVRELTGQLRATSAEEFKRYTPEYRDRLTKQVGQLLKDQVLEALGTAGDDVAAVKSSLKPLGACPRIANLEGWTDALR